MFNLNEGWLDRIIRVVGGLGLGVLGFVVLGNVLGIVLGVVGVILVVTGSVGFCPIYAALRIGTRQQPQAE
ncbi:MAG: DUF2892 domain-containing protein [Chloroflexi bacterium]|nr:DUF2892 domain-containing protein [Chloroflexota bacterium]